MAWLEDVGLSQAQVAKVIATMPSVLGYSIEANLKPTVAWLEDVGLSQPQVAKVIAAKPQVLGLSIEANLKPTVAWLEDVGLRTTASGQSHSCHAFSFGPQHRGESENRPWRGLKMWA